MKTPAYIQSLQPYQPGMPIEELARKYGLEPTQIIKLASNENPLGPSPKAIEAIQSHISDSNRYPDQYALLSALSSYHNLPSSQLVVGNGSNDVLDLIARVYLTPGTNAISSQYAFVVYSLVTTLTGATNVIVPAITYGHDISAMQKSITADTRVVWIANPNNPTGTLIPHAELQNFLETVPKYVAVVLDEAYYEYLPDPKPNTIDWLKNYENLIIVRTFSKIHGLAALRVGYAMASPEVAELLNRVRQPFNVNQLGLAAATAALTDHQHLDTSRALNQRGIQIIEDGFTQLGIEYIASAGNFITARFTNAQDTYEQLLKGGIIVRPLASYGMAEHLRITLGLESENQALLTALHEILQ